MTDSSQLAGGVAILSHDRAGVCGLKLVHDAEWKSLDKAVPYCAAREQAAGVWMSSDFAQGAFDLPNKIKSAPKPEARVS